MHLKFEDTTFSRGLLLYGAACLTVAAAFALRLALSLLVGTGLPPYITFYPAVMLAALLFGMGPGLFATAAAAVMTLLWVLPSLHHPASAAASDALALALFALMGVFMSVVAELYRRARQKATAFQHELTVRESEARFHGTLENMLEGCQIIGFDWTYLYVNDVAARHGHLPREQLLGRTMMAAYPGIETTPMFASLRRCMEERVSVRLENEFAYPDGSIACFDLSIQPAPEGVFVVSYDVSERKRAEKEITALNAELEHRVEERTAELSAANEELDAFAYAVSHDLRAPLRAMGGFSQALLEDFGGQLAGGARDYLGQITAASTRMGELIEGILRLSRSTRGELKREKVDLSALADRIMRELRKDDAGRSVDWSAEPGLAARCDPALVEAVLYNLLGNALKYTTRVAEPAIRFSCRNENGQERFCVSDNGAGFDMRHTARLFQPFQRLHRQDEFPGIGIGLATVQRIIRRHGGTISAAGEPGKGASFTFSLSVPGHAGEEMT